MIGGRRAWIGAALFALACVEQPGAAPLADTGDESETGETEGDDGSPPVCGPPTSPLASGWSVELDALPEVEAGVAIAGEFLSLELPCTIAALDHDGARLDYALDCAHPDAGSIALGLSVATSEPPAGVTVGAAVSYSLRAASDVGPADAASGGFQEHLLRDDDGPLLVILAGTGVGYHGWGALNVSLLTACAELGPDEVVAGYVRAQLGYAPENLAEVEVGETGRLRGTVDGRALAYELRVYAATILGCCHGAHADAALARVGG